MKYPRSKNADSWFSVEISAGGVWYHVAPREEILGAAFFFAGPIEALGTSDYCSIKSTRITIAEQRLGPSLHRDLFILL